MKHTAETIPVLHLTGRMIKQRFEIVVNGASIALSGMSFFYLFQLAFQAVTNPPGWLRKEEIQNSGNEARYIYRMNQELGRNGIGEVLKIDNNRTGCYRLALSPTEISFDCRTLQLHPDIRIREKALKLSHLLENKSEIAA